MSFSEDNDFISAKSAAQILSLNLAFTFVHLNFGTTDLCNSAVSCSFALSPNPCFLSKDL